MISNQNILELKIRKKIYNLILQHPGLHERKISRRMNIPKTTLKYHLNFLKKRDLLTVKQTGRYHNYFVKEKVGIKDKKILCMLQKESYRKIMLYLLIKVVSNISDISEEINKHPSTVGIHLKKLLKEEIIEIAPIENGVVKRVYAPGVIECTNVTNEKIYRYKDPKQMYDLVITYRNELKDEDLTDFIKEVVDYRMEYGYPKRIYKGPPDKTDIMLEKLHEVFPHPYRV
jgi:DNA-binding transcriptional ArsR family regulator